MIFFNESDRKERRRLVNVIVRISENTFTRGDSYVLEKKLRVMKRPSSKLGDKWRDDVAFFNEELNECASDQYMGIKWPDRTGLYRAILVVDGVDYESGYADEWHYEFEKYMKGEVK